MPSEEPNLPMVKGIPVRWCDRQHAFDTAAVYLVDHVPVCMEHYRAEFKAASDRREARNG